MNEFADGSINRIVSTIIGYYEYSKQLSYNGENTEDSA